MKSLFKKTELILINFRWLFLLTTLLLILIDTVSETQNSDWLYVLTITLWAITTIGYQSGSKLTLTVSFISLLISIFFYLFNYEVLAEKLSIWTFVFFISSILRLTYEVVTNSKNEVGLKEFLTNNISKKAFDRLKRILALFKDY